ERADAGDGFNASDSGGDGLFTDDFQNADVAHVVHVCAAAEFFGIKAARGALIGNGYDADIRFRVFVAEEGECSGSESVIDGRNVRSDLRVVANLVVHLLLDVAKLFGVNVSEVGKVETQTVGRVERASLFDVRAKN